MKSKYLPLLAGLLTIGTLCASGSPAAAAIEDSISGANTAKIGRIARINDIQDRTIIGSIADQNAIARAIGANGINRIWIAESETSDTSLIAIENIINANIQDQIDAKITKIAV